MLAHAVHIALAVVVFRQLVGLVRVVSPVVMGIGAFRYYHLSPPSVSAAAVTMAMMMAMARVWHRAEWGFFSRPGVYGNTDRTTLAGPGRPL